MPDDTAQWLQCFLPEGAVEVPWGRQKGPQCIQHVVRANGVVPTQGELFLVLISLQRQVIWPNRKLNFLLIEHVPRGLVLVVQLYAFSQMNRCMETVVLAANRKCSFYQKILILPLS